MYLNKSNGKDALFLFKIGWSHNVKRLSLTFKWNSELLEASTVKLPKESSWLYIRIWSLTAVDFFDLDGLFVKAEISYMFTNSNFKMKASFVVIGSIASTTRKLIINGRA